MEKGMASATVKRMMKVTGKLSVQRKQGQAGAGTKNQTKRRQIKRCQSQREGTPARTTDFASSAAMVYSYCAIVTFIKTPTHGRSCEQLDRSWI